MGAAGHLCPNPDDRCSHNFQKTPINCQSIGTLALSREVPGESNSSLAISGSTRYSPGTSTADPENIAILSETSIEPVAEKYCTGTHAEYLYPIFAGKVPAIQVFDRYPGLTDAQATEVFMNLTTFQLRFEVFEGLRQMYAEQPLIIPTNILHYSRFSGQPSNNNVNTNFHATLSQCLENCDSIFILVPNNTNQQTCFYQPYLTGVRMALGEFGIHPQQYVNTFDDPRFIAMALDALNLETSEITAMNEDVARSLTSPRKLLKQGPDNAGVPTFVDDWNQTVGDCSNFFIGTSLSQVGFQAGTVSSPNTNIPFIFDAHLAAGDMDCDGVNHDIRPDNRKLETSIICLFLIDAAHDPSGSKLGYSSRELHDVKLTNKSIV
jgi:hypothetical protein